MPSNQYILIMAGGAGTRLWPISRTTRPKQFQALANERSLLQNMVELALTVVPIENLFVMATPEFSKVIESQIPGLPKENLLYEPARRDNGPAIVLGMAQILRKDSDAQVAILWSDHLILKPEHFTPTLKAAFAASAEHPDALVTVGTKPTEASTSLGYIQMGDEIGTYDGVPVFTVKRFHEKPDQPTADHFVSSWDFLWNLGYKVMSARAYIDAFQRVQPEIAHVADEILATDDHAKVATIYEQFPKLSDEYLVTQYLTELLVVPTDLGWSDIGNWDTLHKVLKGAEGMVTRGEVTALYSENSLAFAKDRPIVLLGVKDLIVVDDGDVIMVMNKDAAGKIKEVGQALATDHPELL